MRRTIGASCGIAALSFLAIVASEHKPFSEPTAEQILDKAIEATGGKEAWEKIRTVEIRSTMETMGMKVKSLDYRKIPDLFYKEVRVPGLGTAKKGFDGKVGWTAVGAQIQDMPPEEIEQELDPLDAVPCWRNYFSGQELKGRERVEGREAFRIELVSKAGGRITRWYDAETFLLLQEKRSVRGPIGAMEAVIRWQDYREVEGVKMAHKVVMDLAAIGQGGGQTIESIRCNVEVDDRKFQKPAEPESGPERRR